MFNNKNSNKRAVSNSTNNSTPNINIISEGTKVKGNMNSNSDIRIAGTIEGEALSKGKLIVTSTGNIKGDVKSAEADIAGRLEGEVRVTNRLILRSSAVIDGNIYTKSLLVEEGAQINGACRMGTDPNVQAFKNEKEKQEQAKAKTA